MAASIFLVEDDEAVARLVRHRLEAAGHSVREFAHAGAALDEIDAGATADLYLLDVTMPAGELHGLALARMIKTRFSDAHIIFLTGNPDLVPESDRTLGLVVAKPIDFAKLLSEIERLMASGS
jgi:CheY-like chemotaxis protein